MRHHHQHILSRIQSLHFLYRGEGLGHLVRHFFFADQEGGSRCLGIGSQAMHTCEGVGGGEREGRGGSELAGVVRAVGA